jgi:hypothetical protein
MAKKPVITLGGKELTTPSTQIKRMAMVIWGPSGSGKTTLAATAPRPILWLNFDPDGTSSLMDQENIYIADYSMDNPNKVVTFKHENAGGVKQTLEDNPEIQTVVFDSITSFNEMALKHGITEVRGASMEMPTLQGYGRRNSYTMQGIMSIIRATGAVNKHVIFIAHEDMPKQDEMTGALMVSILVGGKMQSEIPIKLSEVWHLEDTGKERKVSIRSSRLRKPMKTRMFVTSGDSSFNWSFDPETWEGEGIEDWYKTWVENEGRKIPLP